LTLTSKVLSQWLSSAVSSGPKCGLVAPLLNTTSSPPSAETARSTIADTCSGSPVWQAIPTARPPSPRIASATASTDSCFRLTTATAAPAVAQARAIASPMPREPPVTSTALPVRSIPSPRSQVVVALCQGYSKKPA
jgi:hypothetical protein